MEDGLGLTTVTGLLAVVTTLALGGERVLALLVLRHLMRPINIYQYDHITITYTIRRTCAFCTACLRSLPSSVNISFKTSHLSATHRSGGSYIIQSAFRPIKRIAKNALGDVDHFDGGVEGGLELVVDYTERNGAPARIVPTLALRVHVSPGVCRLKPSVARSHVDSALCTRVPDTMDNGHSLTV